MINKERAVKKFMEIVQIDSVSLNEKAMAEYLIRHFQSLGYEAIEDKTPLQHVEGATVGNVIVKIPGNPEMETIILEAHMDTVEPGNGVKPSITDDGKYVVSDGTTILGADDKAGIAQILEVVQIIHDNELEHAPLELLFTMGEELGIYGATYLDMSKLDGRMAYVLDGGPGPGDAIVGGPDYYEITGTIFGKASHAGGAPDKGISSIQVMSHAIAKMNLLKIDDDTTSNVGSVICDYPLNVVPELTKFGIEVRSLDPQKGEAQVKHVVTCIEDAAKQFGARVEIDVLKSMEGYRMTPDNKVFEHFTRVCQNHNIEVKPAVVRGGTDVSGLAKNNIDAIAIAAGGQYAHELRERLDIETFLGSVQQVLWLVTE